MRDLGLIMLTRRKFALVDAADYGRVNALVWCVHVTKAGTYAASRGGKRGNKLVLMHRFILGLKDGVTADHTNGIGLDNRRENLRVCKHNENCRNRRKPRGGSNPYKGVWWHKDANRWMAGITINGKRKYLGLFEHAVEAAHAYDTAAIEIHGSFAKTNAALGLLPA